MGDDRVCLSCGQRMPPPSSIFDGVPLTPGQRRIAERVLRAGERGISGRRLFDILYDDEAGGGPLTGLATLRTRVHYLNKQLAAIGKEVRAAKGGGPGKSAGGSCYVLRDVSTARHESWREMWSRPFVYPERV